jgi:hypothetical protein
MRLSPLPLIAFALVPALARMADQAVLPQSHPPLEPPIRRVRLHPDEAWITRVAALPGLSSGSHRIILTGLPAGLKLEDVRITARGPLGTRLGELALAQETEPYREQSTWKQLGQALAQVDIRLFQLGLREQNQAHLGSWSCFRIGRRRT